MATKNKNVTTQNLSNVSLSDLIDEISVRIRADSVIVDADPRIAAAVVAATPDTDDGRSVWKWVRFGNGDLMLGTFPRGDTYELTEVDQNRP